MEDNMNEDINSDIGEEEYEYPSKTVVDPPESEEQRTIETEDFSEQEESAIEEEVPIVINKKMQIFLISALAILSLLVVALISYIIYGFGAFKSLKEPSSLINNFQGNPHVSGESEIKFEEADPDQSNISAESIYEMLSPSVVGVVVYDSKADIISNPLGEGSGIIISEKGYIVTNSHVVGNSKQNNIKIVLNTEEELPGKVLGYDSKTDIAVIKVEKTGLKAATFGNSDEVKVGSSALALGNPLGLDFASSLTRGIISALNRSTGGTKSLVKYIQTDAAINPGNSGGPLINMHGQVIGINSSKIAFDHCEGMGFAIPSNTVKSVVDDIIDKGYVSGRVRLGMMGKLVSNYQAQIYNVPVGIIVSEINSDSNLPQSGVKVGDIITKINNVSVTNFDTFYAELYNHKAGESISLSIYRPSHSRLSDSSETFEVSVVLLEDKGETQETRSLK